LADKTLLIRSSATYDNARCHIHTAKEYLSIKDCLLLVTDHTERENPASEHFFMRGQYFSYRVNFFHTWSAVKAPITIVVNFSFACEKDESFSCTQHRHCDKHAENNYAKALLDGAKRFATLAQHNNKEGAYNNEKFILSINLQATLSDRGNDGAAGSVLWRIVNRFTPHY
jgi:hypothetical protein